LEYDDYTRVVTHLSASMVPSTLAMGEDLGASGRQLLEAFIFGFQIASQLGKGMRPVLFDRGFHPVGILGAMGSAIAGCRMMGLATMEARMALGIAASEASGIRKNVGSMGKAFHAGHGARCGVFAAMLARAGFKADPDVIDDVQDEFRGHESSGFAATFNGVGQYDMAKMYCGLGSDWELARENTVVKFHPGATPPAAAIDGMIALARQHDIKAEQVERIDLECTPPVKQIGSYNEATDGHKARFCLPYSMAVALIDRKAGLPQYADERVRKPDVQALMKRVRVSVPEDYRHRSRQWGEGANWGDSRIAVHLKNGKKLSTTCAYARGWPETPANWDDIAEKYMECCDGVLPAGAIKDSLALIDKLETLTNIKDLLKTLQI
jgi:2-methylcitrate dehydratase PrpD